MSQNTFEELVGIYSTISDASLREWHKWDSDDFIPYPNKKTCVPIPLTAGGTAGIYGYCYDPTNKITKKLEHEVIEYVLFKRKALGGK